MIEKKPTLEYARRGTVRRVPIRPQWSAGTWLALLAALVFLLGMLLLVRQISTAGFSLY